MKIAFRVDASAEVGKDLLQTAGVTANAVDTNGADDMYAGAFLYAINAGHDYALAAKFANAGSVRVVSQFGSRTAAVEYEKVKQQFGI